MIRSSRTCLFLLGLLVTTTLNCIHGLPRPFSRKNVAAPPPEMDMPDMEVPPLLGEEDDEQQTDYAAESVATIQVLYGTALLLYGRNFPEQIMVLTMMRATGFATIETAIRTARKNMRMAVRFAIWRTPSFLKMRQSIFNIHNRIDDAKREMAATKKAKKDGVITPSEERELRRMHKRDIHLLRRDRARIQRGMINLGKFMQVLDLVEIFDIIKSFLYQLLAVLVSGHSDSTFCVVISSWCHFLSLGSLLVDGIQKLMNSIIERQSFLDRVHKQGKVTIGLLGKAGILGFAFYLMEAHGDYARRLNAALLEAAIILRGLRYFVDAAWDRDEDSALAKLAKRLEQTVGGLLLVILTSVSLYCADLDDMWTPQYLLIPVEAIEKGIVSLVDALM